jgi:hypothetical protein
VLKYIFFSVCYVPLTPLSLERSRSILQVAKNSDIFAAKYLSGVIASVLQELLAALNKCTEWGQVFILDALEALAKPKASSSVTPPPTHTHTHPRRLGGGPARGEVV